MDYNELREFGKIWILMGVFSTCFFASCGQNPASPPESATPVSHTKTVSPTVDPSPVDLEEDYESTEIYSEDHEGTGFGETDFDDLEREIPEYTEDIPRPTQPSDDTQQSPQEVSSNTQPSPYPEVAFHATSAHPVGQDNSAESQEGTISEDQNSSDDASSHFAVQADEEIDSEEFAEDSDDDTYVEDDRA